MLILPLLRKFCLPPRSDIILFFLLESLLFCFLHLEIWLWSISLLLVIVWSRNQSSYLSISTQRYLLKRQSLPSHRRTVINQVVVYVLLCLGSLFWLLEGFKQASDFPSEMLTLDALWTVDWWWSGSRWIGRRILAVQEEMMVAWMRVVVVEGEDGGEINRAWWWIGNEWR